MADIALFIFKIYRTTACDSRAPFVRLSQLWEMFLDPM
jgi:hypothetical protein